MRTLTQQDISISLEVRISQSGDQSLNLFLIVRFRSKVKGLLPNRF